MRPKAQIVPEPPVDHLHTARLDADLSHAELGLATSLIGPAKDVIMVSVGWSDDAVSELLKQSQHQDRKHGESPPTSSSVRDPGAVSAASDFSSARPPLLCVVVEEGLGPGHGEESVRGDRGVAKFERTAVHCQGTSCLHEDGK